MLVEIPWNGEDTLRVMNIYAPVRNDEKPAFWRNLHSMMQGEGIPKPDLVMGDFNLVENPEIDRLTNRGGMDPMTARDALSEFTTHLNLTDGWRRRHPRKRSYTFIGQSQSRLDRIYATEEMYPWCTDWNIEHPAVKTDHQMVSVRITTENMPFVGKGRWAIPTGLLKNRTLRKETQQLAKRLQTDLNIAATEGRETLDPQLAFKSFKDKVVELYRNHQKTVQPKIINSIRSLQKGLEETTNSTTMSEEEIATDSRLIKERIDALEKKRKDEAYLVASAKNKLEGETLSKYWCCSAKGKSRRDTVRALRNPLGDFGKKVTRSDEMAKLARDYHESLMSVDRNPLEEVNDVEFNRVTRNMTTALDEGMKQEMGKTISSDDVETALRESANEKAPGLNGIPTEVWKMLHQQYKSAKEETRHLYCNITEILAYVFNDIAAHGITTGTGFNEGWMCHIYKKKEADNVANYRPITVLNTDYKIFTKVIATRLSKVAPHLIHPDQAGFIRGRSIFDQIEQTATTINYAKLKGVNGAIVALDQEKAYDKLTHPYLWKILRKLNFPEHTIKMIKILYQDARTSVILNGIISEPFAVTRGVRQGDPMSCISFNLGIESLAANIRSSKEIRGINVPNLDESVKVSLFADDTTVILAEHDSMGELNNLLEQWCSVSGAKSNVEKTEIIPFGTSEYRRSVRETRRLTENGTRIPETIHIAADKEATRILGAWIGNETNPEEPWRRIVETIKKDFARWETRFPTLEGKRHIVQMIAGGKTHFLARAQGMPEKIQNEIQKLINSFVWEKEVSSMKIDGLSIEIEKGGRKILDIRARNDAINLMWVKDYLRMNTNRPKWAYMADEIFRMKRPKRAKSAPEEVANWNPFTQDWQPSSRSRNVPERVKKAMRLAVRHGAQLEAVKPNLETRMELPIWLHRKTNREAARLYKREGAKCLKTKHKTHYVGQILELVANIPDDHRRTNFCACRSCADMSLEGCTHPNDCMEIARKLLDAIAPSWNPELWEEEPTTALETPTVTENEVLVNNRMAWTNLENSIRIFTTPEGTTTEWTQDTQAAGDETIVYTDGSCPHNGTAEARAESGAWFGDNDPRNAAIRVPGREQSNQIGELMAILYTVKTAPRNIPLRIRSDSRFAIEGLTKHARTWEEKDWIGVKHGQVFKCTTAWIRARQSSTTLQWVKGHAGIKGNEEADKLAAQGAQKETTLPAIDLRIPEHTMASGAMLTKATQSMIYQHLKERRSIERQATQRALSRVEEEDKDIFGLTPTANAIWRSMRHRDISKKARDFLWKHAHGIFRLGSFWNNIPGLEERGTFPLCQNQETFQHIIQECSSTERKTVWKAANRLWKTRYDDDLPTTEGAVLGCGLASFTRGDGKPDAPKNRLYRILMSESAHLIWILRCERRIRDEDHSERAIYNRWDRKINDRMRVDCLLTNEYLFEKKALKTKKVYDTWTKYSTSTTDLRRDWCRQPGVLVGKDLGRPAGRTRR
jgi:ribonuclease HI